MKPIDPPEALSIWVVASITASGSMSTHSPSAPSSTIFPGYYTKLEDAQQEQMLLALKGIKAHVFQLDFPRP
jgi:hypothetical protein